MALSRRDMIRNAALGAGVVATGNVAALLTSGTAMAAPNGNGAAASGGYGRLVPDPNGILDLPPGFAYSIVSDEVGEGLPGRFDGTGAYTGPNRTVQLVRNHEQTSSGTSTVALADPSMAYDVESRGGTSTVVVDHRGNKIDEYVSLAGTHNNCAGGETPWGTWLSCEETTFVRNPGTAAEIRHGYVFEVDPGNPANNVAPQPLRALGRFAHEAAVVDPRTLDVYMTEDSSGPNGLVYKCVLDGPSPQYGGLRRDGTLYAMSCSLDGQHAFDLHAFDQIGTVLDVAWSEIPDPDPGPTDVACKQQLPDDQITRSRKFEGMWWDGGKAYIVCSFAEGYHDGQVWSLDPGMNTLTLEVRFEINAAAGGPDDVVPDQPDNITISPWGGMILCEDSGGTQHLIAVAPDGSSSVFARNMRGGSEFTGACFSPDRHILFVNIQSPGVTFAITGPFARINRAK